MGKRKSTLFAVIGIVCIVALTPAARAANATEDVSLGFKGLGARIGLVDPEGASSTLSLGLHIDAGQFARNVHLSPIAEYWSVGSEAGPYNIDITDFSFGGDITVDFPLQDSRVTPYAGGGIGLHWLSTESNIPGSDDTSDTKLGLNLQGGVRTDAMPNLALFGELRYNFVKDANQLKLLGGFTYRFVY